MNPLNLSSHLQNKTVHYKLFCTHRMSTYNRIHRDDQGYRKRLILTLLLEGGSKVILGFIFYRLNLRQKNVIIVVVFSNQIRSTDAIYPSIGVWSSVFFVGRKQLTKKKNWFSWNDMRVWCRIVKLLGYVWTDDVKWRRERECN